MVNFVKGKNLCVNKFSTPLTAKDIIYYQALAKTFVNNVWMLKT
jgi:hypothetical protein